MSTTERTVEESIEAVRNYVKQRTGRRNYADDIHAVDVGCATEGVLTLTDLRVLLRLVDGNQDDETFPNPLDETRTWAAQHRPDIVSQIDAISAASVDTSNTNAQGITYLIAIGFAAGREYEKRKRL